MTPEEWALCRRMHDQERAREIIAMAGQRTKVGRVSIKTDDTGKVRIEPAKRKQSVSKHISQRKSTKQRVTRKLKGAQRP